MMDAILMILLTLQITTVITKKQYSSSESIENILYYKDCKHKKKEPPVEALRSQPPPEPRPPACPCPKMCCSMCCECTTPQSFLERQMNMPPQSAMMQPLQAQPSPPKQPPIQKPVQPQLAQRKRKKVRPVPNPDSMLQPPIGGRRDLGFTRENIKNLIAQDSDLKKILKDLVTVTMKKVDLFEMAKTGMTLSSPEPASEPLPSEAEEEEYDD